MPLVQLADSYMHIYPKQIKDQKELTLTSSVDVEIHNQQVFADMVWLCKHRYSCEIMGV